MLPLEPWLEMHTTLLQLWKVETLVTLRRNPSPVKRPPLAAGLRIEPAMIDDTQRMTVVDQTAFIPPYQMTYQDMRRAYRASTLATVVRLDNQIVGYQISTKYGGGGHLARLAVLPGLQGLGIGSALVRDMLAAFQRRQVDTVSVNTQSSNLRSLALYKAYGFQHIRYDMPIYCTDLDALADG
jgi:ribosomal protein S18 acetylase RimI-like enzyme